MRRKISLFLWHVLHVGVEIHTTPLFLYNIFLITVDTSYLLDLQKLEEHIITSATLMK